jgi:hypothetical protein
MIATNHGEANHWKHKEVVERVVAGVICQSLWRFLAHNFNLLGAPSIVEAWFGGIEDGGSWQERLVELTGIEQRPPRCDPNVPVFTVEETHNQILVSGSY